MAPDPEKSVKLDVHAIEADGVDCLTGNTIGEVWRVSFADGTLSNGTLSQKSLLQLVRLKLGQNGKKTPTAQPE